MRYALLAAVAAVGFGLPASAAPITKQVTIRPIQLCDNAGSNCAPVTTYESAADKIWAQAGIDFAFMPVQQWWNTSFLSVNADVGEEFSMFSAGSGIFGDPATTGIINMYFLGDFTITGGTLYGEGCGAPVFASACQNTAGVAINAPAVDAYNSGNGRIDTVAHEVGHVLGLTHTGFGAGGADNLMTAGSDRTPAPDLANINPDGSALDKLTNQQITEALGSSYVGDLVDVPEPASMMVLAMGMLGVGAARRRRG